MASGVNINGSGNGPSSSQDSHNQRQTANLSGHTVTMMGDVSTLPSSWLPAGVMAGWDGFTMSSSSSSDSASSSSSSSSSDSASSSSSSSSSDSTSSSSSTGLLSSNSSRSASGAKKRKICIETTKAPPKSFSITSTLLNDREIVRIEKSGEPKPLKNRFFAERAISTSFLLGAFDAPEIVYAPTRRTDPEIFTPPVLAPVPETMENGVGKKEAEEAPPIPVTSSASSSSSTEDAEPAPKRVKVDPEVSSLDLSQFSSATSSSTTSVCPPELLEEFKKRRAEAENRAESSASAVREKDTGVEIYNYLLKWKNVPQTILLSPDRFPDLEAPNYDPAQSGFLNAESKAEFYLRQAQTHSYLEDYAAAIQALNRYANILIESNELDSSFNSLRCSIFLVKRSNNAKTLRVDLIKLLSDQLDVFVSLENKTGGLNLLLRSFSNEYCSFLSGLYKLHPNNDALKELLELADLSKMVLHAN